MKRNRDDADSVAIEQTINVKIAEALRALRPQWRKRVQAERSQKNSKGRRVQPDIKILYPGNPPVVIESEILPNASKVEDEADARLRENLPGDTRKVEQAIALRIPRRMATADDEDLLEEVKNANDFEYCVISDRGRWPAKGWIEGGGRPTCGVHRTRRPFRNQDQEERREAQGIGHVGRQHFAERMQA